MNTNVAPSSCPQCGGPIPADAREGLCPRCALAAVAATETERPGEAPPTAPTREAVATALPQFEILELIGQGGMGCVFKARQPQLDRLVALKILPAVLGREPKFTERFLREAKALARMSHPNIVTVHDSGQAGGFFYLVMEFVDGVSLRQLLRERRLKPEEALAIVPRICEALQFAHEKGVVHRDIKPENVLLDKQGRVKIADFGIAKLVAGAGPGSVLPHPSDTLAPAAATESREESGLTQGHVLGTPHYMAPEQVERPDLVDHRADIYSLGVVFYEMLTGELPLGAFQPPSSKVQIDVRLDEIVLRALEKKPERRYQQASEVKTQVERITATHPDRGVRGHNPSLDLGQLNPAVPGTAPWVALGVTVTYTGTLLFGLLCTVLRGGVPGGWLVATFAILACASPLVVLALQRFVLVERQRTLFKVGGWLASMTALPVIGFAAFFLMALIDEGGGWNPAPDESVVVPLIWLGAVVLPICGWRLSRGVTTPGPNPADANPLPVFDFWQDLEAGDYEKYQLEPAGETSKAARTSAAQPSPVFAAIAVAAMLLLIASGNATVMLIGSAVLLVIGLIWCPQRRWRIALLVALASMGVAAVTVMFLNRRTPGSAPASFGPLAERVVEEPVAPDFKLTVAQDGSGTHTSVQAALDDAIEGAVVRISPGRYEEPLLITKSVSLVGAGWNMTVIGPAMPLAGPTPEEMQELDRQFRAAKTDEERVQLRQEAQERFFKPLVRVRGATRITFEGIKLSLPGTPPEGKLLETTVVEVSDAQASFGGCAVVGSPGNGIVLADGAHVTISNTLVTAAWNTGILVERGTNAHLTVIDSDIRNCHYAGVVIGRGQNNVTIERCRVSGAAWHGIRYDHASPTITGSLIFANARSGIYASGESVAQVRGNVLWGNEMNGMSCWFENRDHIEGNTFAGNLREGLSVLGASIPRIERNIFWQNPRGILQGNIGGNPPGAKASAPLRLQENLFWTNEINIASALGLPPGDTSGPAPVSLETFPGNFQTDPGFQDGASGDFALLPDGVAGSSSRGAPSALDPTSPWPMQPEEQAIIPVGDTRDSRQWRRPR